MKFGGDAATYVLSAFIIIEVVLFQIVKWQRDAARALVMEARVVLREIYDATSDGQPLDDIGWRLVRRPLIMAVLSRIEKASRKRLP